MSKGGGLQETMILIVEPLGLATQEQMDQLHFHYKAKHMFYSYTINHGRNS
jgi:hypothetical protein